MPSSPLGPQFSPPARDFVEFGQDQRTRTLEWACARRRLVGKAGHLPGLASDDEATDVEPDEAVTPPSTWNGGDARWGGKKEGKSEGGTKVSKAVLGEPDDDTMKAALALCGLMRG
jgi:hypothetical protein